MLKFGERLEGHELVVGLRSPGVDLDGVPQRDHQKLDTLVLHDLEVNSTLKNGKINNRFNCYLYNLLLCSNKT